MADVRVLPLGDREGKRERGNDKRKMRLVGGSRSSLVGVEDD